jgi:fructokinase
MKQRCVAVMGEALIDFTADGDDARIYHALAGGSGFNTALGLARLDVPTAFCGSLSSDAQGARLARDLADEGVDTCCVLTSARPSPIVLVQPGGGDAPPHYSLHLAGTALDDAPDAWSLPPGTIHVHATSFASTIGAGGRAAMATLAAARSFASASFDPNIRSAILPDRATTTALIAERVACSDIVKVSAEDLGLLAPGDDPAQIAASWLGLGPRLVVLTRAGEGASAFFGARRFDVAAPSVKVRDTIGAGDSFMAALLASLWDEQRLGPDAQEFREQDIAHWMAFAVRAAARTCTREGADPPRRQDLAG